MSWQQTYAPPLPLRQPKLTRRDTQIEPFAFIRHPHITLPWRIAFAQTVLSILMGLLLLLTPPRWTPRRTNVRRFCFLLDFIPQLTRNVDCRSPPTPPRPPPLYPSSSSPSSSFACSTTTSSHPPASPSSSASLSLPSRTSSSARSCRHYPTYCTRSMC